MADLESNEDDKTSVTINPESIKWISCRGGLAGEQLGFREAVLSGWASDGGMLLPTEIPSVTQDDLDAWRGLSYQALCSAVLSKWIPVSVIGVEDLIELVNTAFDRFGIDKVVDLSPLPCSHQDVSFQLLELFHGPTLAFKDLGMSVLCQILQYFLKQTKSHLTLLVGTSGDTGPSALEAVRGMEDVIDCVVLYPIGRVSKLQEEQMLHCGATMPNASVVAVEGTSDDLDVPCEAVLKDSNFKDSHSLGTVNSVNIVRMLVQTVHYFYGYLHQPLAPSDRLSFSVPSGAAGHLCAGVLARLMGLPLHRLLVATNDNDVLDVMIRTGRLGKSPNGASHTLSNAMDIQVPYNYERLLYLCCRDHETVAEYVRRVNGGEMVSLPEEIWKDAFSVLGLMSCSIGVVSSSSSDDQVLKTIKETFDQTQGVQVLDPHTAVGVTAARWTFPSPMQTPGHEYVLCMGCAHPAKFVETISTALGMGLQDTIELLSQREPTHRQVKAGLDLVKGANGGRDGEACRFLQGDNWTEQLKNIIQQITDRRNS